MVEPVTAGLLVGGVGLHKLLSYNRENFFFDNEQNQKRQYQGQEMRVVQFDLYRDDVRCLVELTCQKMDIYITVTALLLGFLITMFCEGKLDGDTPHYLLWLYPMHLAGAFVYYLISLWLAVHASISAHAAGVRLLTQKVRLPVPTSAELNATRGYAKEFEQMKLADIFRVPVFSKQLRDQNQVMNAGVEEEATAEEQSVPAIARVKHILEYRKLQANWQSYDAYARVSMAMGTNQLLFALAYYSIGYQFAQDNNPYTALAGLIGFSILAVLIARLDLYSSERTTFAVGAFILLGPLLTLLATILDYVDRQTAVHNAVYRCVIPLVYLVHGSWMLGILFIARPDRLGGACLPTRFRAVLYLDVFGWLDADRRRGRSRDTPGRSRSSSGVGSIAPGARDAFGQNLLTLQQLLQREFQVWQKNEVASILEGSHLITKSQELYAKFRMESQRLHSVPEIMNMGRPSTPRADPRPLFLKFELDLNGYETQVLFYNGDSEEILWDQRELPASHQTCDIEDLEDQVERLASGINMLTQMNTGSSAAGGLSQRSNSISSVSHVSLIGGTSFSARRGVSKPGQIPWRTFWQGTTILFVVWVLGFIWCVTELLIFQKDLPMKPGKEDGLTLASSEQVLSGPWHPFFEPQSLACHPGFDALLIAERYRVHTLSLNGQQTSSSILQQCLQQHSTFVARGISGVSVSCSSVGQKNETGLSQCWALLLRSDGSQVLRCPLVSTATPGKVAAPYGAELLSAPHDHRWRAIGAGAFGAQELWGLGDRPDALTSYQHETSKLEEKAQPVRPRYELTIPQVAKLKQLQVVDDATLWGLSDNGYKLLQWPLGGARPISWKLPKHGWAAFCTTGTHIYSIGQSSADSRGTDWTVFRSHI